MAFRTKLDFSSNRQVKQRIETFTSLSGGTRFGVPFSSLPTGPDLNTVVPFFTGTTVLSTFSGNSASTIYSWYYPQMNLALGGLSAITPTNSGVTQNTSAYTATSYITIDGNTVAIAYSGVSFDITPVVVYSLGGGNYSGSVQTATILFLSAGTLDFTGRTIWNDVSGITRTEDLIITRTPLVGATWTCIDSEGKGSWIPASAATSGIWIPGTGLYSAQLNGSANSAQGNYSVSEGRNTAAQGHNSHSEGQNAVAYGENSHAEGLNTTAIGDNSHAEGWWAIASGETSHAEGYETIAYGSRSHAEGYDTQAIGDNSHSEGYYTSATTTNAHSEGKYTLASGLQSHAEGSGTTASGSGSHAEGIGTSATTTSAHAEGRYTLASGVYSHAEGYMTVADSYAHAQGKNTWAQGDSSHAEGIGTYARGGSSHAQGSGTTAFGNSSFSSGVNSYASGTTSFVHGTNSNAGNTTTIVLGDNITGTTANTTYVASLNIKTVGSTAFLNDIRIDANGNLTTNTSDERLKENIAPLSGALITIKALQGVSYQWKDRNAGTDAVKLGFIAQQVDTVDSRLAFTNPVDGYMGLHIDGIIPLLVEATKELEKGITSNDSTQNKITIPSYTPTSSTDTNGNLGNVTMDDDYLYIRSSTGWKRTNLESF